MHTHFLILWATWGRVLPKFREIVRDAVYCLGKFSILNLLKIEEGGVKPNFGKIET